MALTPSSDVDVADVVALSFSSPFSVVCLCLATTKQKKNADHLSLSLTGRFSFAASFTISLSLSLCLFFYPGPFCSRFDRVLPVCFCWLAIFYLVPSSFTRAATISAAAKKKKKTAKKTPTQNWHIPFASIHSLPSYRVLPS